MCVAIAIPKDVPYPNEEVLHACEQSNNDGGGLAWVEGEGQNAWVRWKKGLTAAKIVEMLAALPPGTPALIHFRIASVGPAIPELTHPFPVTSTAPNDLEGRAKMVMIHNGTWSGWRESLIRNLRGKIRGDWSDTRAMAYLAGNYGKDTFKLFDEKIATLSANGEVIIYRYKQWDKDEEGRCYSNLGWRYKVKGDAGKFPGTTQYAPGSYSGGHYQNYKHWNRGQRRAHDTGEYPIVGKGKHDANPQKAGGTQQSQPAGVRVDSGPTNATHQKGQSTTGPTNSGTPTTMEEDTVEVELEASDILEAGDAVMVDKANAQSVEDYLKDAGAVDDKGNQTPKMRAALCALQALSDDEKTLNMPGWLEIASSMGPDLADQLLAADMCIEE